MIRVAQSSMLLQSLRQVRVTGYGGKPGGGKPGRPSWMTEDWGLAKQRIEQTG